jgi:transposase
MGQRKRKYTEEFKREAVAFSQGADRPLREVADELKVPVSMLYRWRSKYGASEPAAPLSVDEAAELRRLRRRVATLEQERDFLKKAAAYFANPSS